MPRGAAVADRSERLAIRPQSRSRPSANFRELRAAIKTHGEAVARSNVLNGARR
jgi:hypothetical protein